MKTHHVGKCDQCRKSFFLILEGNTRVIPPHKVGTGQPPFKETCIGSFEKPIEPWVCKMPGEEGRVYRPEQGFWTKPR